MAEITYGPKDTQIIDVDGVLYFSYNAEGVTYVWQAPEGSELWEFTDMTESEYNDPDFRDIYTADLDDAGYLDMRKVDFEKAFIPAQGEEEEDRLVFAGKAERIGTGTDSITRLLEDIEDLKINAPWWSNPAYVDKFVTTYINNPDTWQDIMAADQEVADILTGMGISDATYNRYIEKATDSIGFENAYLEHYEFLKNYISQQGAEVDDKVLRYIANEWNHGRFSKTKAINQVVGIIDPHAKKTLDAGVLGIMDGTKITTITTDEDTVQELMDTWLPESLHLSNEEISKAAGKIRNNSSYKNQLIEEFKDKRFAMYGMYDRDVAWGNIVSGKRSLMKEMWGQDVTEGNAVLESVIKMNDTAKEREYLRRKGLEAGIQKVTNDLTSAQLGAYGAGIIKSAGFRETRV
jgi:hypothetical protein